MNIQDLLKRDSPTVQLIKHFESLHDGDLTKIGLQPKMDPVGIWTVAYGHAITDPKTGKFLQGAKDMLLAYQLQPTMTEPDAEQLLCLDLQLRFIPALNEILSANRVNIANMQTHQYGALLSFIYNCGTHYKNKLGILKPYAIWANVKAYLSADMSDIKLQDYWSSSVVTSQGVKLAGLVRRRKSEYHLFRYGKLKFENFAY